MSAERGGKFYQNTLELAKTISELKKFLYIGHITFLHVLTMNIKDLLESKIVLSRVQG